MLIRCLVSGLLALLFLTDVVAQAPLNPDIRSIKLFRRGDQFSVAVIRLGEMESLELHFDDLGGRPKNYFYTYELRNSDWSVTGLSQMDFIRGFTQMRLNQYRLSSATFTKFVHYQTNLPQANCVPSRSGNYLLKVFENGDTSKLLFTRRIMVVDEKIKMAMDIRQPFAGNTALSHQKVITQVALGKMDIFNPAQQVRLVVMQNNRWDNAQSATVPAFIRDRSFEYSFEDNFIFEGGKEWRWADLRSFRFQSDRVADVDYKDKSYDVYLRPDSTRPMNSYIFFGDRNGMYEVGTIENINPWWQTDYANVHFTYIPADPGGLDGMDVFVFGELTGYTADAAAKMQWNPVSRAFETNILLKNGFYNYGYGVRPKRLPNAPLSIMATEGSVWNAENQYLAFFYYRDFGGRADELIGFTQINSLRLANPPR